MKYDEDYSNGHINLFAPHNTAPPSSAKQPKSILKHTNYRTKNPPASKLDDSAKNFDDLNIRAYSITIHRDDFNAMKIESKDNLIPWNGDQSILIDRYDCRLYLHDLDPHDADLLSDDARQLKLTHEENEVENLCEFERYLDLVEDENVQQQEPITDQCDSSRAGAAIGFTYDASDVPNGAKLNPSNTAPKNERLFVPDDNLRLPHGCVYPETVKLNHLVVKTASFVAKQGLQAEILLKTKQSTNSQFNFLNYGDMLHSYYKHVVNLIRDKKIDPLFYLQQETEINSNQNESKSSSENEQSDKEDENSQEDDDDEEDNYLHPLLSNALGRSISVNKSEENKPNNEEMKQEEETKIETKVDLIEEKITIDEPKVEQELQIEEPSGNEKVVIDKLAEYVGRNGVEFEENLRKKNDARFEFLNDGHKFYAYYMSQVKVFSSKKVAEEKENETKTKRKHKSKKNKKSSDTGESESSSESSSSSSSESEEEKKKREKRKDKKKHKRRKSKHEKSSSSRKHRDSSSSRKKHKKRSRSRSRH